MDIRLRKEYSFLLTKFLTLVSLTFNIASARASDYGAPPAPNVDWSGCTFNSNDFSSADLSNANLSNTRFNNVNFSASNFFLTPTLP